MASAAAHSTTRALVLVAVAFAGCQRLNARRQVKDGNDLYAASRFASAAARFDEATRLEPTLATAWLNLGYSHLALFKPDRSAASDAHARAAIAAFTRFMALRPDDPRPKQLLLSIWMDSGRAADAIRFFEEAHRKNPSDLETVRTLGVLASKAGRFDDALRWYRRRADLAPRDAEARYAVGTLCWEALHGKALVGGERLRIAGEGLRALDQALALRPTYVEAMTYMNLLYRERAAGQTDEGARKKDLDDAEAWYKRALAARTKG